MPRLRVDRDTQDTEIIDAMHNLIAAGHVIDDKLTATNLSRSSRAIQAQARDDIHTEINRLVTIMAARRARKAVVA